MALLTTGAAANAETGVLVFPGSPTVSTDNVEETAKAFGDAGFELRELGDARAELAAAGRAAKSQRETAIAELGKGLETAQSQYLDQDFGKMIEDLDGLRTKHLWLLGEPGQRTALWDITFQIGLAHHSRNKKGDKTRAAAEFTFATAIDSERRPPSDVYGPDVGQAFATAIASLGTSAGTPLDSTASVDGARLTIDGVAVIPGAGGRALKPGLHVVHYAAPGHESWAEILDTREPRTVRATLSEVEGSVATGLGDAWFHQHLRPGSKGVNRLLLAVAKDRKASLVAFVLADEVIVVDRTGEVKSATLGGVAKLVSTLDSSGSFSSDGRGAGTSIVKPKEKSNLKWYLIGGAVGIAIATVAVVLLVPRDDRVTIGVVQ